MKLLTPIRVGPVELKNRVVSTAHEAFPDFFQPGADGERYMAYQERRAAGGAALLIGAAMYGLAREGGSYGGASRGKTLALGGVVGAILAGVAPTAVNMLFEAAS